MIIAGCQHALAHSHRHISQLGPVELFDGGVEGVAVDVDYGLREVAGELELGYVFICAAQVVGEIELFELSFAGENACYLLGELLVLDFFVVEEFGAFGGVVDDFGDLSTTYA
jgi:hypothetical protein